MHYILGHLYLSYLLMLLLAARIAVFLFTIHPIHVEAVTSIVGRADALCGVFYLLAVWSYTLAVRRMDSSCCDHDDDRPKDSSLAAPQALLLFGRYCYTHALHHLALIVPLMVGCSGSLCVCRAVDAVEGDRLHRAGRVRNHRGPGADEATDYCSSYYYSYCSCCYYYCRSRAQATTGSDKGGR